jgi:hypothetical protein
MTTEELLESYPLSTEIVRKWFFNQMISSMENESVPEEFKQAMMAEAVTNERLATLIDVQPRTLFDVFDQNDIIILIKYHDNFGWSFVVEEADDQSFYKTRKEAEIDAIKIAFEILEEQLNN